MLGRCGIDIRGRARKLRLNYRTTEETRRWAEGLLEGQAVDDLDGGADDNRGIRSITSGPEPRIEGLAGPEEQAAWIVAYLKALPAESDLRSTCIVARTRKERDSLAGKIEAANIPLEVLETEAPDDSSPGVRLATMHRVKGLEFDRVLIASANQDPNPAPRSSLCHKRAGTYSRRSRRTFPPLRCRHARQKRANHPQLRQPQPLPLLNLELRARR